MKYNLCDWKSPRIYHAVSVQLMQNILLCNVQYTFLALISYKYRSLIIL